MFIDKEHRGPFEFSDELGQLSIGTESAENVSSAHRVEANDKDLLLSTSDREENKGPTTNGSAYDAPPYESSAVALTTFPSQSDNSSSNPTTAIVPQSSFAIDDLLGLTMPVESVPAPPPPALKLNPKAVMDPSSFQQKWRQLPISLSQVCPVFLALAICALFLSPYSLEGLTF